MGVVMVVQVKEAVGTETPPTTRAEDLSTEAAMNTLNLQYLIKARLLIRDSGEEFFNDYFTRLAGTRTLQAQIEQGLSEEEIRASWQPGLDQFKTLRKKYLLYKDFE